MRSLIRTQLSLRSLRITPRVNSHFLTMATKKGPKDEHSQCEYKIEKEGKYTRYVQPYFQEFRTHAKGRWLGREVLEVFCREFGAHPPHYWVNAMRNGQVRINGRIVGADYKFKNSDQLLHRAHRHEPPVFGEILLVGETDDIVAISKPPSLPMHPCGAYRHNSLEYILKREALVPNQPNLLIVHRLDRVTSGLVILAKSKAAAQLISQEIRDKATTKVYLARVKGRFPTQASQVPHLRELPTINLEEFADETEDYEVNGFKPDQTQPGRVTGKRPLSEPEEERVSEVPVPAPVPAAESLSVGAEGVNHTEVTSVAGTQDNNAKDNNAKAKYKKNFNHKKSQFGRGDDIDVKDLPPLMTTVRTAEEVGRANNVGILFSLPVSDALENANTKRSAVIVSCSATTTTTTTITTEGETSTPSAGSVNLTDKANVTEKSENVTMGSQEIWVKCPLGVVSQRDGIHACDPTGKPSLSIFRSLGYCAESDTSLVECRPYTGRTHQLRLHLQLLGTPIANDPCYGGVLFYGDDARRVLAVDAVKEMRQKGIIPLSKVPHFGDPEVDNLLLTVKSECSTSTSTSSTTEDSKEVLTEEVVTAPNPGETEDEYLVRTCRYCQDNSSVELEHLLHCDGIWLHALRYTGPPLSPVAAAASAEARAKESEGALINNETSNHGVISSESSSSGDGAKIERVERRWAFQSPYPSWAAPFVANSK